MSAVQKTTEVLIILSPTSGEDSKRCRVTVRCGQLLDMLEKDSYAKQVIDSWKKMACEVYELDMDTYEVELVLPKVSKRGGLKGVWQDHVVEVGMYTSDVIDVSLLLH